MTPLGHQHEEFTAWAREQGVEINGVEPAKFPGRGLGVIARCKIEAGEVLVRVPASALLSTQSIPERFRALHKGITVHGLLASFLAFGGIETSQYSPWKASWPALQEFQESMPILWPEFLQEPLDDKGNKFTTVGGKVEPAFLLPPAIGGKWRGMLEYFARGDAGLLYQQKEKLKADWAVVSKVFPDETLPKYTYYWLIVSTRSFYFDALEGQTPESHDDRIVLCPFIDYFNHKDHGCEVAFGENGYMITSDRAYDVGEEIYTSYGAHGNDFLLVEYGFTLQENKWDRLPLDDFFCGRRFNGNTKNRLKMAGYFGDYTLNHEGVCYRTQVAVRTQTLGSYQWKRFVERGETNDERDESRADSYLCVQVLQTYYEEAENSLGHLRKIGDDRIPLHIKTALISRWEQIKMLIRSAVQNGINPWTQAQIDETFDAPSPFVD